jgi:hypothetical protein
MDSLAHRSELESAGGIAYLSQLADDLPRVTNVLHYAQIVREKAVLRRLIYAGESLKEQAFDPSADPNAILAGHASSIAKIREDSTNDRSLICVDATKFVLADLPKRKMLLEPFVQEKSIGMVHAWRGVGKTHLLLGMAAAIASGGKFLKWSAPEPVPVLHVDGEMVDTDLQGWIREALCAGGVQEGYLQLIASDLQNWTMPSLCFPAGQKLIEEQIGTARVIFFDNVSSLFRGEGSENDDEAWQSSQEWLLSLRRNGIASILGHHDGKSLKQRGTSKREDVMSWVLQLKHPQDYTPEDGLRAEVHFEKARKLAGRDARPFELQFTLEDGRPCWTIKDLSDAQADAVRELRDEKGMSFSEAAKVLNISKGWAKKLYDRSNDAVS